MGNFLGCDSAFVRLARWRSDWFGYGSTLSLMFNSTLQAGALQATTKI